MKYTQVKNPKWADQSHTEILVLVNWSVVGHQDWARLIPTDPSPHIQTLLAEVLCGEHGEIAQYIPPAKAELDAQAAEKVRAERNMKLATEVDPIAGNTLRWAALTAEQQQAWADYRQALLDIPQQAGFPNEVVWPVKPTEAMNV